MQKCFSRKASSQEEGDTAWCLLVKSLDVLDSVLVMLVYDFSLTLIKDKSCQSREENWCTVKLVDTQSSSRTSMMSPS